MSAYKPTIFIIEDDDDVRHSIITSLSIYNYPIQDYSTPITFLKNYSQQDGCIVSDIQMPQMNGLELQEQLNKQNLELPLILITAFGNIKMAVTAIKKGAYEFIEKPFDSTHIQKAVTEAINQDYENFEEKQYKRKILERYETLTPRETEILSLLSENNGTLTNQSISEILHISKRTVEVHRSTVMAKMLAHTRAELVTFCHCINNGEKEVTSTETSTETTTETSVKETYSV